MLTVRSITTRVLPSATYLHSNANLTIINAQQFTDLLQYFSLQCSDTVGWVTTRVSAVSKNPQQTQTLSSQAFVEQG